MKVKELIEQLQKYNPEAEAIVSILGSNVQPFPCYYTTNIKEVCVWGEQFERKMMGLTSEVDGIRKDGNKVCVCITHNVI